MQQLILIDKFIVPLNARTQFVERMNINRSFIKTLPGFIKDTVYEQIGAEGEYNFVTLAVWENEEALKNAKQAVSAYYQKQVFNLADMLNKLNIKIDRAVYKEMEK
jgi:heme-degrading monooxygenase HmoA